jgi:ABC-type iron transport system FetAB ATPase subunit
LAARIHGKQRASERSSGDDQRSLAVHPALQFTAALLAASTAAAADAAAAKQLQQLLLRFAFNQSLIQMRPSGGIRVKQSFL